MKLPIFEPYLQRWSLMPDGNPIVTPSGHLLPVRQHGVAAMLKVAQEAEERSGCALMVWWDGNGAAPVLGHEDGVLLMERATGPRSLETMARNGEDDEASRIICAVADRLHAPRAKPSLELIPLEHWFEALLRVGPSCDGVLKQAAVTARQLLADQQEVCVLHADLHHGNVLDFGPHGWLAIDPKRVIGDRGFDYANIFCNPDAIFFGRDAPVATSPGRLARQAAIVAKAGRLDRMRLLKWILAYSSLSAVWCLEDNQPDELALEVAKIAAAEIARG
jgi:streptomycin 6-kinase